MANGSGKCRILAALLLASAGVTGCAVRYQLPDGEPRAKVRFMTTTWAVKRVLLFEEDGCEKGPRGGQITTVGGWGASGETSKLQMADAPEKSIRVKEREIPANKTIYVAFAVSAKPVSGAVPEYVRLATGGCSVTVSFLPKEGREYEVVHTYERAECGATVMELVKSADGSVRRIAEPTARIYERQCSYRDLDPPFYR